MRKRVRNRIRGLGVDGHGERAVPSSGVVSVRWLDRRPWQRVRHRLRVRPLTCGEVVCKVLVRVGINGFSIELCQRFRTAFHGVVKVLRKDDAGYLLLQPAAFSNDAAYKGYDETPTWPGEGNVCEAPFFG